MLRIAVRYANQALFFPPPSEMATLGAAKENDFVVPFPGISRRHAQFVARPGGLWISDLGSKNGLLRGDQRHAEVLLLPGETLQIGKAVVGLEEISSSDADITLVLPPPSGRRQPDAAASSDTDPIFETGGHGTPGSALALVRRIETSSRLELGSATTADLMERARQTLGAELLLVYSPSSAGVEPAIEAIAGPVRAGAPLCPVALESITAPGDGLPIVALAEGHLALARRLPRKPHDVVLAAVLPPRSGKPAGWKLDFFDYLAEKLVPAHRKPAAPSASARRGAGVASGAGDADPLRFPPELVHGGSLAMEKLFHHLRATVQSTMDVLLLGETGTGKELIARLVHASGHSAKGPFVAINCAAIPSELLEADLFGVEARVATGVDPRPGLFAKAEGGTLFLDEIGDMAERLQAKLLRVLQERDVLPVGAHPPKKIHVRVISASNQNLAERVQGGTFRADLYYRLKGLQFHLPPLRERREDIPILVERFLAAHTPPRSLADLPPNAVAMLESHAFPGNVRELRNTVARLVLFADLGDVTGDAADTFTDDGLGRVADLPLKDARDVVVERFEKSFVEAKLKRAGGVVVEAAASMGVSRQMVYKLMDRYGIPRGGERDK